MCLSDWLFDALTYLVISLPAHSGHSDLRVAIFVAKRSAPKRRGR